LTRSRFNHRTLSIGLLLAILPATIVLACRYTVRDIGFVELRGAEFSLSVVGDDSIATQTLQRIEQGLRNSNVRLNVVKRSARVGGGDGGGDGGGVSGRSGIEITLIDRGGRRLRFNTHAEPGADATSIGDDCLRKLFTETRDSLARQSIGSFAQIVVIDGSDPQKNERAWGLAGEAAEAIRRIEPMLPRPIAFPVRTVRLSLGQRMADPVLMWSLGTDVVATDVVSQDDEATISETVVAVIYGRGRLAGPVMTGDAIAVRETLAQLALVGESCECETDRKWLDERVIPYRWAADDRELAARRLGFDPDSPLVRAEMIRIVSQGVGAGRNKKPVSGADGDAIERLLLGYTESSIAAYSDGGQPHDDPSFGLSPSDDSAGTKGLQGDVPQDATSGASADAIDPEMPLSQVRAQIIQGDGWDFDDQESEVVGAAIERGDDAVDSHDGATFPAASQASSNHEAEKSLRTYDEREAASGNDRAAAEIRDLVDVMDSDQSRPIRIALLSSFLVLATVSLGGAWIAWGKRST
jgi:hypothetical protein